MNNDIVAYSQCEACDEQRLFLDPASCARCLSGQEPVEIDEEEEEENELAESFLSSA